jgi:GNAT superfamily N-acetyltransferase
VAIYVPGRFGIINEFYVLPEYRCFGIGKRLVDQVLELGKQNCWKRIEVGAPNNEMWHRTIEFYLREGFLEIGPRLKKYLK